MRWRALLESYLPEHARRAGSDTLAVLEARLQGRRELVGLWELYVELHRELQAEQIAMRDRMAMLAAAQTESARRSALTEILLATGGSRADVRALDRWLDLDAIEDRGLFVLHRVSQQTELVTRMLAGVVRRGHERGEDVTGELPLGLVESAVHLAEQVMRDRSLSWNRRAASAELLGLLAAEVPEHQTMCRQSLLEQLGAWDDDPWVQAAALESYAETRARDGQDVSDLLRSALIPGKSTWSHLPADHCFVRARAARLCGVHGVHDALARSLELPDPSEHVRIESVRALTERGDHRCWLVLQRVLAEDPSQVVRSAALVLALPTGEPGEGIGWVELVRRGLEQPREVVVVLLGALLHRRAALARDPFVLGRCWERWHEGLWRWSGADGGDPDEVSEQASLLMRWFAVQQEPARRDALDALLHWTATTGEGARLDVRVGPLSREDPDGLLEVLSVAAADGFDLSASPLRRGGYRFHHGARSSTALWRLVHELTHPAPNKRQAYPHSTDRVPPGSLIALSRRGSEVTPTRVPGQRVSGTRRLSWGAHLPLPSFLVAAARHGAVQVATPTQQLVIRRRGGRLLSTLSAHRHYVRLASLRERVLHQPGGGGVEEYDEAAARARFVIERRLASAPLSLALPELSQVLTELVRTDTNTLLHLAVLSGAFAVGWMGRSLWIQRETRRLRRRVPLVIGGWGSRGKSGTERLKAALFHGLGYRVVSKTTGCEAMIITSIPGGEPTEIFLFRPYDKATIWEQRAVLRMAAELEAQVLLWECMALRPEFVDVLQRDWMRDDLSTVTNTYPDHEDVQGPSGRDVAEVIGRFVPRGAVVLTTEQHMLPVLEQRSRDHSTRIVACAPESWRLLPRDLLARFPYAAHPRNIALVLALCEELQIERDVALKAMADHVVPDLGVLKEYGPVTHRERTLSFVNGMSANERAGFLSNWERMDLGSWGDSSGIEERLTVVMNNRADRPARQEAFVHIALDDVSADVLAVIGTNVGAFGVSYRKGLRRRLRPRLLELVARDDPETRTLLVDEIARRLRRVPLHPTQARALVVEHRPELDSAWLDDTLARLYDDEASLDAALGVCSSTGDPIRDAVQQWLREVSALWRLQRRPEAWEPRAVIDGLLGILAARLLLLTDPALTGDQVLDQLTQASPPGTRTRILGCENIKGTGLDFVYRWVGAGKVLALLERLVTAPVGEARELLLTLAEHRDWGVVDAQMAADELARMLETGRFRLLGLHQEARSVLERLERVRDERFGAMSRVQRRTGSRVFLDLVESAVDFRDSMRRRRQADRLFADLTRRRVGTRRAAEVAKELTSRQKGGWLTGG